MTVAAQEAAKNLSEKFSGSIIHNTQLLDANQLQRLCVTLGRSHLHGTVPSPVHSLAHIPTSRTRLPRGYHLVYFTPYCFEKDLEPDGAESSQVYNQIIPPPPFTRRMWAGGSIEWFKQSLRVNHFAHETTKLARASAKQSHGDWKLRLNIEKAYYLARGENPGQIALIDRRTWIYSKPEPVVDGPVCVSESSLLPPEYKTEILDMPDGTQQLIYSPVALFRFSALIFNSHMIHYNESWTRQKEGHPGLVVHVPLIIINVLDFWRDSCRRGDRSHKGPVSTKKIDYRIMAPIYAGERFTIEILPTEERLPGNHQLWLTVTTNNYPKKEKKSRT
ncbi:hypothetical protein QBC38DRAFT_507050 [Podospora fimiseda]|uniref:Uncharacterized protein n=1 Tax=Podospora fimiseda TaxID=252190 RepID=A0AAN7BWN9_9PEZI|nr:hypothetical protein QBC38DRAFT_507050 [Podospora fimiseda]